MNTLTIKQTTGKAQQEFNSKVQELISQGRDFRVLAHSLTLEALDLCQNRKETWKIAALNVAILKMGAKYHETFKSWVKAVTPLNYKDGLWLCPSKPSKGYTHRTEKSTFWTYERAAKPKAEPKPVFERLEKLLKGETGKEIDAINQAIAAIKSGVEMVPASSFDAFKAETLKAADAADKAQAKYKEAAKELYSAKQKLEAVEADSKRKLEDKDREIMALRKALAETQAMVPPAPAVETKRKPRKNAELEKAA